MFFLDYGISLVILGLMCLCCCQQQLTAHICSQTITLVVYLATMKKVPLKTNSHAMHMDHLAENVHIILLVSTQLSFSGPIKEYKQQCVTNILAYKVTNYQLQSHSSLEGVTEGRFLLHACMFVLYCVFFGSTSIMLGLLWHVHNAKYWCKCTKSFHYTVTQNSNFHTAMDEVK